MISYPQWMTIGANVAGINGNWTGGTVGSGNLFAGHNDHSPASACAASSDDAFELNQAITQSLAGRTALLTLYPLSMQELAELDMKTTADSYIYRGFLLVFTLIDSDVRR